MLGDLKYVFMNSFINRIPFWVIRKWLYILCGMSLGKGCRIAMRTVVIWPKNISIGKNTVINEECLLDGRGA